MEGNSYWYSPQITIAQGSGLLALSSTQSNLLWDRVFNNFMNLYYYDKKDNQNSFGAVKSRFIKDFKQSKETPIVRAFRVYLSATAWEDVAYKRDLYDEIKEVDKDVATIKKLEKDRQKIMEAKKVKKEKVKKEKKEKKVVEKIEEKIPEFLLCSDDEIDDLLSDNPKREIKCGKCGDLYTYSEIQGEVAGIKICCNCYTDEDYQKEEKENDESFWEEMDEEKEVVKQNVKLENESEDEGESSDEDESGVIDLERIWQKNKGKGCPDNTLPEVEGKILCEDNTRYIEGEDYELWKTLKKARDKKVDCIGYCDSELNSLVDTPSLYGFSIWCFRAKDQQRQMMDWILE
jgi:hypothetical protein